MTSLQRIITVLQLRNVINQLVLLAMGRKKKVEQEVFHVGTVNKTICSSLSLLNHALIEVITRARVSEDGDWVSTYHHDISRRFSNHMTTTSRNTLSK